MTTRRLKSAAAYVAITAVVIFGGSLYVSHSTDALCAYQKRSYPIAQKRYQVVEAFLGSAAQARFASASHESSPGARSDDLKAAEEYTHLKAINQPPLKPRC